MGYDYTHTLESLYSKRLTITNVCEDMEKLESLCIAAAGGGVNGTTTL